MKIEKDKKYNDLLLYASTASMIEIENLQFHDALTAAASTVGKTTRATVAAIANSIKATLLPEGTISF